MVTQKQVKVGGGDVAEVIFGNNQPMTLIAGPCALESREHAMEVSEILCNMAKELGIGLVYKTSYDKANRTSGSGFRGIGMDKGLEILAEIREKRKIPVLTDVHLPEHCKIVAEVVDILQIPAFMCRQTDLLEAAAETGRALHIKKGQFLAPWDMVNVVKKVEAAGNTNIILCERGASFGYQTLISDMRSLPIMRATGYPVIFDATHSVQQPGSTGSSTGGKREFVPTLARSAVAAGVAGVFLETHEDPDNAPSDGPNMVYLKDMPKLVKLLQQFDAIAKANMEDVQVA